MRYKEGDILEVCCPYCKVWFDENELFTCPKCNKSLSTLTLFMRWRNPKEPNSTFDPIERWGYHGERLD